MLDSLLYSSRERLRIYSDAPRKGSDMGCLGVHFAITEDEACRLKAFQNDDERVDYVTDQLEESYFPEQSGLFTETDKAWDAIHRALSGGELSYTNGDFPLSHAILGGEQLHSGDEYILSLKTPEITEQVAVALKKVTREDFRKGYLTIPTGSSGGEVSTDDFEYSWYWLMKLQEFYTQAAAANRFVLFAVSQ